MLTLFAEYQTQLFSVGTVVLGFLLNRVFRLKPRLNYSIMHASNLLVNEPLIGADGQKVADRQIVRNATVTVANAGLQAARSVEVTFNWKPPILNITPARHYDEAIGAFDRYSLKLDSLAPGEQFTIEIMAINAPLPELTVVRSEDAIASLVRMEPQRVFPTWFNRTVIALVLLGAVTAVYLVVSGLRLILA